MNIYWQTIYYLVLREGFFDIAMYLGALLSLDLTGQASRVLNLWPMVAQTSGMQPLWLLPPHTG